MTEPRRPLRILFVEDSEADAELVEHLLRREGYDLTLERVFDRAGLASALDRSWDLLLCDYGLPGFGAFEALEVARECDSDVPFVILSGTIGEEGVVELLKAGARDCVLKSNLPRLPFVVERELAEAETRRQREEAGRAVAELESRLRRLTEHAPDIIYSYGFAQQAFEYLSPAVQGVTGYSADELCGNAELIRRIVHPDDWRNFAKLPESGRVTHVSRWFAKDGRELAIELNDVAVVDDGVVVGVEGVARDITQQRRAEQAALEREAQLRLALDSAQMLAWTWNLDTDEVTVVGDVERFGIEVPRTVDDVFSHLHPDDRAGALAALEKRLQGEAAETEVRMVVPGQAVRWLSTRGRVVMDASGRPISLLGTAYDVTDRKQAEETLRQTQEALQTIVRATPVAIGTADRDLSVTSWNPACERIFGWTETEVLGKRLPFELGAADVERIERALAGESLEAVEVRRTHKDGTPVDILLSLTPLRASDGKAVTGLIATLTDVTEQVRARRLLEESYESLKRVDAERRRLLERLVSAYEEERQRISADIHDDSVQVLTALALQLDILAAKVGDRELREPIDQIRTTARSVLTRLRHLIFDLCPPALDQSGLAAALRTYLEELRFDRGVEFQLENNLTGEPAIAARMILYRVAQEALINVAKHAQASRVTVRLDSVEGGVRIRVADDGRGMPRANGTVQEHGHLGLAAMRERAEMAGGWWRIESSRGSGTTVEFFVPRHGVSAPPGSQD